ncbi:DUF3405 domain-containing protein [Novipirellula caenicola]|uniref:DUF707 domain-containing protein n=1 Tax=Novipirellula caenicola TaxID=1536901 RepID=A0ABP9W0Z2_9BACT
MNICVLFLTHESKPSIMQHFDSITLPAGWSKHLLVDEDSCAVSDFGNRNVIGFRHDNLVKLGYRPIAATIVPGSAHFPVIEFAYTHQYDYVWAIEFDVHWTANWLDFFNQFDHHADFLTTQLRRFDSDPEWVWWDSMQSPPGTLFPWHHPHASLASFNPIYRLSSAAVAALRRRFLWGWTGHNEVTIATLLEQDGFIVADMDSESEFKRGPHCKRVYSLDTMRWRPEFSLQDVSTFQPNQLYHPVKH